jgi:hypothetical protein
MANETGTWTERRRGPTRGGKARAKVVRSSLTEMEQYKHTQIGYVIIFIGLGVAIPIVRSTLVSPSRDWVLLTGVLILAIGTMLFGTLTIEIKDGILKSGFGPGLIRKTVRLADIEACRVVRNPWYYGWGIRMTPHGWLYNVSGTRAVEITLKGAGKFRLGTDEPEVLCQAIMRSLAKPPAY